jgi:hypothetical protein
MAGVFVVPSVRFVILVLLVMLVIVSVIHFDMPFAVM